MADYRDQAFQINKENPYYEQTASNNAMIGAGMQNLSQGFQQGNQGGGANFSSAGKQPQSNYNLGGKDGMNYQGNQYPTNVG